MTNAEYWKARAALIGVANAVREVDLPALLAHIVESQQAEAMEDPRIAAIEHTDRANLVKLIDAAMPLYHEVRRRYLEAASSGTLAGGP